MATYPPDNIYWRDIPTGAPIRLRGEPGARVYVTTIDGVDRVAFWEGREAGDAQRALDKRVKATPARDR